MSYNTTIIWESKTLDAVFGSVNELTGGLLFNIILVMLFFLILMAFPGVEFGKLLIGASFFVTFIAFLGFVLGFTSISIMILPVLLLSGSVVYYFLTKN